MTRERKIYDSAFKIKAVELSNERSNITELSRELGIRVSMLYNGARIMIHLELVVFLAKAL